MAAWILPLLGALALFRAGRPGQRLTWLVIACACGAVVLDKGCNLQEIVHQTGQDVVRVLDPEHRLRGPHLWWRYLLLGGLALAGVLGLVLLMRLDRSLDLPKALCALGLVTVIVYLGARLVPALHDRLQQPLGWVIEGGSLLLILGGELLGWRRISSLRDG